MGVGEGEAGGPGSDARLPPAAVPTVPRNPSVPERKARQPRDTDLPRKSQDFIHIIPLDNLIVIACSESAECAILNPLF